MTRPRSSGGADRSAAGFAARRLCLDVVTRMAPQERHGARAARGRPTLASRCGSPRPGPRWRASAGRSRRSRRHGRGRPDRARGDPRRQSSAPSCVRMSSDPLRRNSPPVRSPPADRPRPQSPVCAPLLTSNETKLSVAGIHATLTRSTMADGGPSWRRSSSDSSDPRGPSATQRTAPPACSRPSPSGRAPWPRGGRSSGSRRPGRAR